MFECFLVAGKIALSSGPHAFDAHDFFVVPVDASIRAETGSRLIGDVYEIGGSNIQILNSDGKIIGEFSTPPSVSMAEVVQAIHDCEGE